MGGVSRGNRSTLLGHRRERLSAAALGLAVWLAAPLYGQSITAGGLRGSVYAADGEPLPGVAVTLEDQGGGTVRELTSDDDGSFAVLMMLPGSYNLLVELEGFQPVRVRGVLIAAGRTTTLGVELQPRPPPITSVTEITNPGASTGPTGRIVVGSELRTLQFRSDATDISRGLSAVAAPLDGRLGFAAMASGLPGRLTRVFADGVPEILLRHPGLPGEPASAPAFSRDAIAQGQVFGSALDTEWRGTAGSSLSLITRSGTDRFEFVPYARVSSAKLGGNGALNPADSAGISWSTGVGLAGPIKRDTAHFALQGNYESLRLPEPYPWAADEGTLSGAPVSVREAVQSIAQDRYSTAVGPSLAPAVRTWKGGSGLGRVDWRLARNAQLMVRAGAASFQEANPLLGRDVGNDAGASLVGRDVSAAVALTTAATISNELRVGVALARRDWKAAPLPATRLVTEAARFGGNPALPGRFETQLLSVSDALQYQFRLHAIKAGVSLDYPSYSQQYTYGASGVYLFGDLDRFNSGTGAYFRAVSSLAEAKVSAPLVGVFLQDTWQVSPGFELLLGLRYESQFLPKNKIARNLEWYTDAGIGNDSLPKDRRGIQPRLGFVFDPGNRGQWNVQGGVGIQAESLELAALSEAVHHSGENVAVSRAVGTVPWPGGPASPSTATRLTMLSQLYRAPRTLKGDLAITRSLSGGFTMQLRGAYHHTDYLLRRTDANLAVFPSGVAQDGRPVWGTLVQQGGLVTASPQTSRRFPSFDLATALSPTGFSDHYEATATVARPVGRSFLFSAEYTFSRTRDNLVGLLAPDPADQLSPFPGGLDGAAWDEGRSDLDLPHRAALNLEFRTGGRYPVTVAARGRWRSGFPFTPGFRSGVDVNGDLGGNNDPASADAIVQPSAPGAIASCDGTSVGGFAARNSCRERAVGSLDVSLGVPLPLGSELRRLVVTVEAFNLVASTTGVVDRAALLIDPAATLTTNPTTGAVSIPYLANPRFGTLLRRGGEPRVVRFGLRVEY